MSFLGLSSVDEYFVGHFKPFFLYIIIPTTHNKQYTADPQLTLCDRCSKPVAQDVITSKERK